MSVSTPYQRACQTTGKRLWRGINPLDRVQQWQNVDAMFYATLKKAGFRACRKDCVFATPTARQAEHYGILHEVIPADDAIIGWSSMSVDLDLWFEEWLVSYRPRTGYLDRVLRDISGNLDTLNVYLKTPRPKLRRFLMNSLIHECEFKEALVSDESAMTEMLQAGNEIWILGEVDLIPLLK